METKHSKSLRSSSARRSPITRLATIWNLSPHTGFELTESRILHHSGLFIPARFAIAALNSIRKAKSRRGQVFPNRPRNFNTGSRRQKRSWRLPTMDNASAFPVCLKARTFPPCLCLRNQYQRKGVASSLISRLLEEAKALHISRVTTHASAFSKPLFEKFGFVLSAIEHTEVKGVRMSRYAMRASI